MRIGSKFFWRLLASYTAILVVTAAIIALLVNRRLSDGLLQQRTDTLKNETFVLEPYAQRILSGDLGEEVHAELESIGVRSGLRITIVDTEGVVLADSHEDPARMDNHGARLEIRAAKEQDFGVLERESRTVGYPMLYVARAISGEEGPLGVVRVSLSLEEVHQELAAIHSSVLIGTAVGFLAALGLGVFVARRITAPIEEMTRAAEDLREGKYERRVAVDSSDEIGVLGATMNVLGSEITARIAHMSREEGQLRAMLAGMVEGVIAVDESDIIAFCNSAAQRLLEIDAEDPVGRRLWEVVRVADLEPLLEGARRDGSVTRGELVLRKASGERVLDAHATPFVSGVTGVAGEREEHGLVIVTHDITDLRRLERVRRDFVANVSHELKTPLTAIKGFVETLLRGAIRDEKNNERFLQRIDDNVDRLTHLVSDLLSLARVESQSDTIALTPVRWGEIVRNVTAQHREAAESKGLELRFEDRGAPAKVLGDAEALTQVIGNLLDNAILYTADGRIDVTLSSAGDRGVLEVQDTGEGIPPQDIDRVFERFYRVDKARSRELGGTGLGLSIVRNLLRAMKGEIRVESTLGEGTRFTVELLAESNGGGAVVK